MKQALLIIDIQNDYFPEGKNELHEADKALLKVNQLENSFLSEQKPIIYIQHIKHQLNADFFEAGTIGCELHPNLKLQEQSIIIEKHFPNSFLETELLETLKKIEIEQLVICGMMTQMCVDSTTRAAKELGFQPVLISDATATKDLILKTKKFGRKLFRLVFFQPYQNFAQVLTADQFLK